MIYSLGNLYLNQEFNSGIKIFSFKLHNLVLAKEYCLMALEHELPF